MKPFKELTNKVYFEFTPDVEKFLKYLKSSGISEKRASFGVYKNNGRHKINTEAYLEIDLSKTDLDLYDVFRTYFRD